MSEEENVMSLDELDARSRSASKKKILKTAEPQAATYSESKAPAQVPEPKEIAASVPQSLEELPVQPKNIGGRPKKEIASDDITSKDIEVMTLMACGMDKTAVANIAGINRTQLYRLLDSDRAQRFMSASKKRIEVCAALAAEIIHSELVKGNVEVAMQVAKGLNLLKQSVNSPDKKKERTTAEEIVEGDRKTRRVIRETEVDSD